MHFSISELRLIAGALRVAASVYAEDAKTCVNEPRTRQAFEQQARDARELADRIDGEG